MRGMLAAGTSLSERRSRSRLRQSPFDRGQFTTGRGGLSRGRFRNCTDLSGASPASRAPAAKGASPLWTPYQGESFPLDPAGLCLFLIMLL